MASAIHPRIAQISSVLYADVTVELYLLKGDPHVLIDTGTKLAPERDIRPVLADRNLHYTDIGWVLNTHGHPDHMGGNAALRSSGARQIAIHAQDATFLSDPAAMFERYFAPVIKAMEIDPAKEKKMFLAMGGSTMPPDRLLNDGEVIDCGDGLDLTVVHLPGHTLGSVGFFWQKEGILFSGDAIAGLHSEPGKLPIILDLPAYQASMRRLQQLDIQVLLCSHAYRALHLPPAAVRQGPDVARYLADSLEVAQQIATAIEAVRPHTQGRSFIDLADAVIARLPEQMGIVPLSQTKMPMITPQSIFFSLYPQA